MKFKDFLSLNLSLASHYHKLLSTMLSHHIYSTPQLSTKFFSICEHCYYNIDLTILLTTGAN